MFPLTDTIRSRTVPVVTWGIILLNALVFFYEITLPPYLLQRFFEVWGFVPARLLTGQWFHAGISLFTSPRGLVPFL